MSRKEIRITGFGGQGVVLCGHIIGHAYSIDAGNEATMIQSFGPEARGSACSTSLVLDEQEVLYPYLKGLDILVAMSQDGYDKYVEDLAPDGTQIYESDLVEPVVTKDQKAFGIHSTRIAEEIGRVIVQNIVMLGFFAAVTRMVSKDEWISAVTDSVPAGTEELNLKAFHAGWDWYEEKYGDGKGSEPEAAADQGGEAEKEASPEETVAAE